MKMNNNNQPLSESLNNRKSQDRAIELFNKLLAQHKKPKNPFDVTRTTTYPIKEDIKPGIEDA
jgi:transposase-like protein